MSSDPQCTQAHQSSRRQARRSRLGSEASPWPPVRGNTDCLLKGQQVLCILPGAASRQRALLRTVFLPGFVILLVAYFQDQPAYSLWQLIMKILFQEPNMIFRLLLSLGSAFLILVLSNSWTFFFECQLFAHLPHSLFCLGTHSS